jgi:hypothetical protein
MLLMIDVLAEDPGEWIARAEAAGVDTTRISRQDWDDQPCWVLGALPGEAERTQVWFDAQRLVPVRYMETTGRSPNRRRSEGRALDYRRLDGRIFHTRFTFLMDDRLIMEERYRDIGLDVVLPDDVFDLEATRARLAGG